MKDKQELKPAQNSPLPLSTSSLHQTSTVKANSATIADLTIEKRITAGINTDSAEALAHISDETASYVQRFGLMQKSP